MKINLGFIVGAFIIGLLVYIGIFIIHQKNNQTDSMLYCSGEELSSYNKDVFINGKKIEDDSSVVVYNSKIFFSVDMLIKQISERFITQNGTSVKIRRNTLDSLSLLRSDDDVYIPIEIVAQYLHINKDLYQSDGTIYIDNLLLTSVNIKGTEYFLTNEIPSSIIDFSSNNCKILREGRAAWVVNDDLYVEDDWGRIYRYKKSQLSIS